MKMKMEHSFYIDPIGIAGGLTLWWSKDTNICIKQYGQNFIDAEISLNGEEVWFGTFIYGPPYKEDKKAFWDLMSKLRSGYDEKWLMIGDSNVVSSQDEKLGGLPFNPNDAREFFDFIDAAGLIDLPISGGTFTWSNLRSEDEAILEKLDRTLCSHEWNITFPKAVVLMDFAIGSDHAPIIVLPKGMKSKNRKDFKFESKWLLEEDCTPTVRDSWESVMHTRTSNRFGSKLRRTSLSLTRWSKAKIGKTIRRSWSCKGKSNAIKGNN
ncbi:hypothetical protein V6N11_074303 [Hibiscus sabdariffa]|uniref:Uncharacterized protein n=1 Tax=Hibiscus sabdariffa TaxID=183260 RepID=A0ABR2R395_9ROSI